jgi:hypothetical protein
VFTAILCFSIVSQCRFTTYAGRLGSVIIYKLYVIKRHRATVKLLIKTGYPLDAGFLMNAGVFGGFY